MYSHVRTNLLCDSFSVRTAPDRARASRAPQVEESSIRFTAELFEALSAAQPVPNGVKLRGNRVLHTIVDGEPVVRFFPGCSSNVPMHVLEDEVLDIRPIGHCGAHELVELTLAF